MILELITGLFKLLGKIIKPMAGIFLNGVKTLNSMNRIIKNESRKVKVNKRFNKKFMSNRKKNNEIC